MVFSSGIFLFAFLPITLILYYIVPGIKLKNALLIIASLIFYAFGEPVYILLMIMSTIVNYLFGLIVTIERTEIKKIGLILAVVSNISVLIIYKYSGFIINNINIIAGTHIRVPVVTLPVGISFFTFQALSYVIDVYRKKELCQKNYFYVLLYISFFPQLVAGPIVRYEDIYIQFKKREFRINNVAQGIRRFIFGLTKKILISNTMGEMADSCFTYSHSDYNILIAWMAALSYLFQIYYDFSGYSDRAIGLGNMFGFSIKENFNYPYIAGSVKEFWRRWHISLSTWFKDYLYIPLGGNRKSELRTCMNKFIVFFVTGLWHGANWTFVVWGLIHGSVSMLESYGIIPQEKLQKNIIGRIIGHVYTMVVVVLAFVIFRADTLSQGLFIINKMFTGIHLSYVSVTWILGRLTPYFITMAIMSIIFSIPITQIARKKLSGLEWCSYVISIILLFLCVLNLSSANYNPFIYFQF